MIQDPHSGFSIKGPLLILNSVDGKVNKQKSLIIWIIIGFITQERIDENKRKMAGSIKIAGGG